MTKLMLKPVLEKVYQPANILIVGIKVSNTPGAVVASTADIGIFLLIGALRNFNHGIMELRRGTLPGVHLSYYKETGRTMSPEATTQRVKSWEFLEWETLARYRLSLILLT